MNWSVAIKRRRRIYFTATQKADIWDRWQRGESMSSIGRSFNRDSSSIHPLISRTGGFRPLERKRSRLALTLAEREEISRSLGMGVTLRQIARVLSRAPSTISREVQRNGGRDKYRAATSDTAAWERAVPGHWEGDLIAGSKNSYVATLVERHTRYVMMAKVANRDTESVVAALIKHAHKLPSELYKSLTWDRGKELSDHQKFTLATNIDVYFCDPRSPWQRGSNENTNRRLRQYLPKGTDLSGHSQARLNAIARQLNERPRKTLDFDTPAERFNACVAMTG